MPKRLTAVAFLLSLAILSCHQFPRPGMTGLQPMASITPALRTPAASPSPSATTAPADPVEISWFVVGNDTLNANYFASILEFLGRFNNENAGRYKLTAEFSGFDEAAGTLREKLISENPPDIVGAIGILHMSQFPGALLDLTDWIVTTPYDLSDFDPTLVEMYRFGPEGQISLPFVLYPSALWYNKKLFDEAGIAYPPHTWESEYRGNAWDYSALREIARTLTLDQNGRNAAQSGFNGSDVRQFGFSAQWTTLRGEWSYFGAGSFVDDKGEAVIPEVWRKAAHWYYDGMWKGRFIPTLPEIYAANLADGNLFATGNLAMMPQHLWYACCAGQTDWDAAAIPSFDGGRPVSKFHGDSFVIPKNAKNPQAAFEVLSLFLGKYALDLRKAYGYALNSVPGRTSLQADAMAYMQERLPGVDLQVFLDALDYPDRPNHESAIPNFTDAIALCEAFRNSYESYGNLNLDAELDKLRVGLENIFTRD
jgi:multiple sugar transport system substrate-binding protein